jgi:hypothetical protein
MKWLLIRLLPLAVLVVGCQGKEGTSATEEEAKAGDHLKPLEWLAGSWQVNSEERQVVLSTGWTLNNNYLEQSFQLNLPEKEEEFHGIQLIGWDPVAKQIHSWLFDSDGGFGEGSWTMQGESWVASMAFTFPDGRRGSSTNIYKKLDDNSYSFISQGRDIEGEWLPDLGLITVTRQAVKGGGQ